MDMRKEKFIMQKKLNSSTLKTNSEKALENLNQVQEKACTKDENREHRCKRRNRQIYGGLIE